MLTCLHLFWLRTTTSAAHLSRSIPGGVNGAERISLTVFQVSWETTKATSVVDSMHTTCYRVPCQIRGGIMRLDEVHSDNSFCTGTKYLFRSYCQGGSYGPSFGHSCHPKNIFAPLLVTSHPLSLPNNIQSLCHRTVPNASESAGLLRGSRKNKENMILTSFFSFFPNPTPPTSPISFPHNETQQQPLKLKMTRWISLKRTLRQIVLLLVIKAISNRRAPVRSRLWQVCCDTVTTSIFFLPHRTLTPSAVVSQTFGVDCKVKGKCGAHGQPNPTRAHAAPMCFALTHSLHLLLWCYVTCHSGLQYLWDRWYRSSNTRRGEMQVTSADHATARSKWSEEEDLQRCDKKQIRQQFLQRKVGILSTNQMGIKLSIIMATKSTLLHQWLQILVKLNVVLCWSASKNVCNY